MTTLLEDLLENNLSLNTNNFVTIENMCSLLLDFSNEEELRFEAIKLFYKTKGYEVVEILKKLVSIFCLGPTKLLEKFLIRICKSDELPFSLRLETCKDICLYKDDSDDLFNILHSLMQQVQGDEITFVKQFEAITTLMRNNNFFDKCKTHMFAFLDNESMSSEYRYKSILSLKTQFDLRKTWMSKEERETLDKILFSYQKDFLHHFSKNDKNDSYYRILALQLLLVQFSKEDDEICNILLSIGLDEKQNYNIRADATDVVLRYGSQTARESAKQLILDLGRNGNLNNVSIYQNAQNAHNLVIEESAIVTLNRLAAIPLMKKDDGKAIDFDYVYADMQHNVDENGQIALNRIKLDNALYGNSDLSLKSALVLIYSFIQTHEYKHLLISRLCEELSESAGICSTGIMERMTNTFSGIIDDLGIKISFEDQILGQISGRLNQKIVNLISEPCLHVQDIKYCTCLKKVCPKAQLLMSGNVSKDEEQDSIRDCGVCAICTQKEHLAEILKTRFLKREDVKCIHTCSEEENCNSSIIDKLLEEMTIPVRYHSKRQTFLLFFRKNFPFIYDDLYKEYEKELDYTTFDLLMRKAVISYVGEE